MSLKIYSDRALVPSEGSHVVMLSPFWGKSPEDPAPSSGRFNRYLELGPAAAEPAIFRTVSTRR